jgi:membrane protease YdiL (CAAX protease family)
MPDFRNNDRPAPAAAQGPKTWDFMETTLVGLIAYGVYGLVGSFALTVLLAMPGVTKTLSPVPLDALATIVGSLAAIAVLRIAIRMAHREFAEYLALNWPRRDELVGALMITAALLGAEFMLIAGTSAEGSASNPYLSVNGAAGLLILLIGGCIVGPMMEEFVVRGFMFRGWSQSFLGPFGAIALTSAIWAILHTQYDWPTRSLLFIEGLALGYFRWRSNSTWLVVMVHSAVNILAFFTMGKFT